MRMIFTVELSKLYTVSFCDAGPGYLWSAAKFLRLVHQSISDCFVSIDDDDIDTADLEAEYIAILLLQDREYLMERTAYDSC